LRRGLQTFQPTTSRPPFDTETVGELLLVNLSRQLTPMMAQAVALELNAARLQGLLEGDTTEERFQNFLRRFRQPEAALAFLREYPVLARQLTAHVRAWAEAGLEFLGRLSADWETIQATFNAGAYPGRLVRLDAEAGDRHRGGRAVMIAGFESGFKLVYKPRSLDVELHFQQLLSWLDRRGGNPPFRTIKVMASGDYGWAEFVEAKSCATADEVRRFYQRQGGYLALLFCLEATDFHFDNLIAAGEHPVLVDLESLFHPRPPDTDLTEADSVASEALRRSVLRTGLLPQRAYSDDEYEGVDLSGLGAQTGQMTPRAVPYWEEAGTDRMRLSRRRVAIRGRDNRPSLNGADVNASNYTEAIITGFTDIYRLLLRHRDELLSDGGPLSRFGEDQVRVVLRPTWVYGSLLRESFHPYLLRDALDRERFFDRLWQGVERQPYLSRIIPSERRDLHNGDIPVFTTRPGSCDLWDSAGERFDGFLERSSLNLVRDRLRQLSGADLERQVWMIRASLTSLVMGVERVGKAAYLPDESRRGIDDGALLRAACSIGDRLETLAQRGGRDATWIGLSLTHRRHWSLVPLAWDLYGGLPGVTLFLAYLGALTGQSRYTELAQAALTTLRHQVARNKSSITSIGGFSGWGGIIYTFSHLHTLWGDARLLEEAEEFVRLLPPLIEEDEQLDVIGGAAGCSASLLSLHACAPARRTLEAAVRCGARLVSSARRMEQGVGWVTRVAPHRPLTGFSHGAAGVSWALLQLSARTGDESFRRVAVAAIDYERSLFSAGARNWPDLREHQGADDAPPPSRETCMTAWCHGAPGIGIARLGSLPHIDDAEIRAEIDAALETTFAHGFGMNHSLCHGDLGNLELLLQASRTLGAPQWGLRLSRTAATVLDSSVKNGWLSGVPRCVETPGLMVGLAGIGYQLLRLAKPHRVPSVLALEPPRGRTPVSGSRR
jgi:type 2 lantibiotic biosynthesis protein LanM